MTDFVKFPKIRQFRDIVRHIRRKADFAGLDENGDAIFEHSEPYPVLQFEGTVKLHGTNAGIVIDENRELFVQSRSRQITVENDNAGFAAFVAGIPSQLTLLFPTNCAVFGEWCGGNIQKGVALNGLDKMFVVFAVKNLEDETWFNIDEHAPFTDNLDVLNENNIFTVSQFPRFQTEIDFNAPELAQERLAEITEAIEAECPAGKFFGVSGVGEGVVWNKVGADDSEHKFKVKGEKHSVSRVKTLAPVDIEHLNNVRDFVEMTVTPQRLEQGIEVLKERGLSIERKNTGDYLRWVVTDILSEEIDQLTGNGLCKKDVSAELSGAAKEFWFKACNKEVY